MTQRLTEEDIKARLLYRDALILVINKPCGIPVHPANHGTHNLEQYFHLLQFGLPKPPTLGHRLDRGTSGCLVLARHKEAARRLGVLFAGNQISKTYWAIVEGTFPEDQGRIDIPLSKQSTSKRHWWMKPDPENGISAITDYQVLKRANGLTWLALTPITGRTHQLRVHCAALGHPILGDHVYGAGGDGATQILSENQNDRSTNLKKDLHLHARSIQIPLYPKKPPICVEAELPPHMLKTIENYGLSLEN